MTGEEKTSFEEKTSLIPDFFFEFIAKIIPGLVAIVVFVYWSTGDLKLFSDVQISILIIVAAWMIGVLLDTGPHAVMSQMVSEETLKDWIADAAAWWYIRKLGPWERGIVMKACAMVIFFRSMTEVCVILTFICGIIWVCPCAGTDLPNLCANNMCYLIFCILFSFAFFLCWRVQWHAIRNWRRSHEKNVTSTTQFPTTTNKPDTSSS